MKVIVNGNQVEMPAGATVEALVEMLGLAKAACASEVNQKLVPKRQRPERVLAEGDVVEVVTLVGGG